MLFRLPTEALKIRVKDKLFFARNATHPFWAFSLEIGYLKIFLFVTLCVVLEYQFAISPFRKKQNHIIKLVLQLYV